MSIKKRILIFITLFGVGAGVFAISLNQWFLKRSLVELQEQQVRTSFRLGQSKINGIFNEMEIASRNLALFASKAYYIKDIKGLDFVEEIIKQQLFRVFSYHDQSIGGGIWFEPYVFDGKQKWYGPYVYKEGQETVFTWDLSKPEYDYHNHDWYRIALEYEQPYSDQVFWSQPYYDDAGTFEFMMTVTTPVFDNANNFIGTATVDWAMKHLIETLESVEFTENASSLLVNKVSRHYLSFPDDPSRHLKEISDTSWESKMLTMSNPQTLSKIEDITFNGQSGSVYFIEAKQNLILGVFLPDSDYLFYVNRFTQINLLLSIIALLLFLVILGYMLNRLFSPIDELTEGISSSVSFDNDSNTINVKRIETIKIAEFTPVINILNRVYEQVKSYTLDIENKNVALVQKQEQINELNTYLEQKVSERTVELEQKTNQAMALLDELTETQNQMVEMEKNTALGQLVTGIAHEVNTSVGVCVTASSILKEQQLLIKKELDNEQLTEPGLRGFLEHIDEVSDVLHFNLERTKELISSFKQISADQSVEESRVFDLADYIRMVATSLGISLKQERVDIELSLLEGVEVDSYPGILSQVINNFVANSIHHGFSDTNDKKITISTAQLDSDSVRLTYTDNGCGMSDDVKKRIFEPFFTTRRGQGNTGLGMHIIYNLITQKLKGTIAIESDVGVGTRIIIDMPIK